MENSKDMSTQSATFTHKEIEKKWRLYWENKGYFNNKNNSKSDSDNNYCIMIPPPNVTGSLHMGHAFQHSLMDVLIRYNRMQGHNTLWQMGTDHAGIATQMIVERQLAEQGVARKELGREKFLEKVWEWKETAGDTIKNQIRQMGSSVNWQTERFTMDEGMNNAVKEAFVKLYDEKLIYRGYKLVNWDCKLQTAVSDLEVINKNIKELGKVGHLYHINYALEASDAVISIATTRPETLFGDVAIAINPEDKKNKHLIGKQAVIPISGRTIPIIADAEVDIDFGTGCVKITPAHDFNDYQMGLRHKLEPINIMNADGTMNENTPKQYQNLDRFIARTKVLEALTENQQLTKTEKHEMVVPVGDRSGVIIEPRLTQQWFLNAQELAKDAISLVEDGDIKFIPDNWKNTYFSWMRNINDWCISRQLWWGHRISAWYDENDGVYVAKSEQEAREKYNLADDVKLKQDEDVLDTWFSSSLWTFATLGWPENTKDLQQFHPTDVLVTGFDIIFFWVARMIMMTKKLQGEIPFKTIYITGLIRDGEGEKMSKTKGNVIDPLDLVNGISLEDLITKQTASLINKKNTASVVKKLKKHYPEGIAASGTDALRFNFCALANSGRDINFDYQRLLGHHHFVNKIWNATKFIGMNCQDYQPSEQPIVIKEETNQWIISHLQNCIQKSNQHIKSYRFDLLANELFEFFWQTYCNWFLEFSKVNLKQQAKTETQYVLLYVLENFLRLLHPVMPFVTEELWSISKPLLPKQTANCLTLAKYPEYKAEEYNENSFQEIDAVTHVIAAIRTIRGKHHVSPSQKITVYVNNDDNNIEIEKYDSLIVKLANVKAVFNQTDLPTAAIEVTHGISVRVPFDECIDKQKEQERLNKELDKIQANIAQLTAMLGNKKFVDNAPESIIANKNSQLDEANKKATLIKSELKTIEKM